MEETPPEERDGVVVGYSGSDTGLHRRRPVQSMKKTWRKIMVGIGLADTLDPNKDYRKPDGRHVGYHDCQHTFVGYMYKHLGTQAMETSRHSSAEAFISYAHIVEGGGAQARAGEPFTDVVNGKVVFLQDQRKKG